MPPGDKTGDIYLCLGISPQPLLLLCLDPKVQPMAKEKCLLDLLAISQDGKSQVVRVQGAEKNPKNNPNCTLQVGNEEEGFTSGCREDVSSISLIVDVKAPR